MRSSAPLAPVFQPLSDAEFKWLETKMLKNDHWFRVSMYFDGVLGVSYWNFLQCQCLPMLNSSSLANYVVYINLFCKEQ